MTAPGFQPSHRCVNCGYPAAPGSCPECGREHPIIPKDRRRRGVIISIAIGLLPLLAGVLLQPLAFSAWVVLWNVLPDVGEGTLWRRTTRTVQITHFVGAPLVVIITARVFLRWWRRRNGPSSLGRLIAGLAIISWVIGGISLAMGLAMRYYTRY